MKIKETTLFLFFSIIIILVSFFVHQLVLNNLGDSLGDKLIKSYVVSYILFAIGVCFFHFVGLRMKDKLGFVFLFWIIAKFMVAYKLLYADFKGDGDLTKVELLVILIPYLLALFGLTFYVVRLLNKPMEK